MILQIDPTCKCPAGQTRQSLPVVGLSGDTTHRTPGDGVEAWNFMFVNQLIGAAQENVQILLERPVALPFGMTNEFLDPPAGRWFSRTHSFQSYSSASACARVRLSIPATPLKTEPGKAFCLTDFTLSIAYFIF